jgi:hypothetical protein
MKIKLSAVILLALMVLLGCSKKKERVYELLPPDPETEKDLTELAIGMVVNFENSGGASGGEGSKKVIDGNTGTKYLINPFDPTMFIELDYDIAQRLDAYTLTSGGDAEGRDPKDWTIIASNDSTTWKTLDTQVGQLFTERTQTVRYEFTNADTYKYYRIAITSTRNGTTGLFQLAEWRMISRPKE